MSAAMRTGLKLSSPPTSSIPDDLIERLAARINMELGCLQQRATGEPTDIGDLRNNNSNDSILSKGAHDIVPENYAQPFLDFLNDNPTVFHATKYLSEKLDGEGFSKLSERESWRDGLKAGGKYYVTRNGSSLVAFSIPLNYKPGNGIGMSCTITRSFFFFISVLYQQSLLVILIR